APAVRVAVLVEAGVHEQPALGKVADDLVGGVTGRCPVEPAVVVVEASRLVDRRQDRQVVDAGELEVLAAAARGDVDDPRALLDRDVVPGDDAMLDVRAGRERVERTLVPEADELGSANYLGEGLVGEPRD